VLRDGTLPLDEKLLFKACDKLSRSLPHHGKPFSVGVADFCRQMEGGFIL